MTDALGHPSRSDTAATMQPLLSLQYILQPIDLDTFKREYWEKRPLHIPRSEREYYRGLLSLADADHILSTSSMRASDMMVVMEGRETPIAELIAPETGGQAGGLEMLYSKYRDGNTIVFAFLHERWKPLKGLCQSLAAELSAKLQTNIYLTPPNAQGFKAHYDTHDVFVLQTEGSKHWRIYEPAIRLPLASQPWKTVAPTHKIGEPIAEFDLNPGDMLYLPRGYLHEGVSSDAPSLHITVGVIPVLWGPLIREALDRLLTEDLRFREAFPPGFATNAELQQEARAHLTELLSALPSLLSAQDIVAQGIREALLGRQPVLEGHLLDLEDARWLTGNTRVRRRPEIQWQLIRDDTHVGVQFHGKTVRFPSFVEDELQFATQADSLTPAELPGDLDEEGKLVFVRTLVKEGFLTVSRSTRPAAGERN